MKQSSPLGGKVWNKIGMWKEERELLYQKLGLFQRDEESKQSERNSLHKIPWKQTHFLWDCE